MLSLDQPEAKRQQQVSGFVFVTGFKFDFWAAMVLLAGLSDAITTYIFVTYDLATEQNSLLKALIQHSTLWIFVYLLARPLLVLFMDTDHRIACSVWGSILGFSMAINNAVGILSGHYFLIDNGLDGWVVRSALPLGILAFCIYHVWSRTAFTALMVRGSLLALWLVVAAWIEFGFWVVACTRFVFGGGVWPAA